MLHVLTNWSHLRKRIRIQTTFEVTKWKSQRTEKGFGFDWVRSNETWLGLSKVRIKWWRPHRLLLLWRHARMHKALKLLLMDKIKKKNSSQCQRIWLAFSESSRLLAIFLCVHPWGPVLHDGWKAKRWINPQGLIKWKMMGQTFYLPHCHRGHLNEKFFQIGILRGQISGKAMGPA